ncbi:MAG TPA: geranylgeranylglyceryl/heptaprenylglyceryl phosphate synthase [Bacteroidia bacterium]|nr:geranylgeranylglyceryl/heptaprenylglyceryl phosphate synthase [Bacteroidia bacterium]HNT79800.1 geranylgeranylglyceryl/heptaprenylglyceryl phosphate synthase [Bacteroidia bacterium]
MSSFITNQGTKLKSSILSHIESTSQKGAKMLSVLVDPDKISQSQLGQLAKKANDSNVDFIFIGGSLLINDQFKNAVQTLRQESEIPLVIFPGNTLQIDEVADAILFLSLISGRNAELLIGNHVVAAPMLKHKKIEVIPTGYMLIDGGVQTTVQYMSNTSPIPAHKSDIAVCTAMAGQMLGLRLIFMDAGSGATNPVSADMIKEVKSSLKIPLIVGGGIRNPEQAYNNCKAGADVLVVGNAIEKDPSLIKEMAAAVHAV